ncbi:MAG: T9SS type A sorting domain-containing protein [Gilvibacter sp.]
MRYSTLLLLSFFTVFSTLTLAQTNTWTGAASDSNWHNASNWSLLEVPNATHDVSVPTAAIVTIHESASCQSLSLNGTSFLKLAADLTVTSDLNIAAKAQIEWNSDQLQVSGILTNLGIILMTDFTERQLHATVINNEGTIHLLSTNLTRISGGSVINNLDSGSIIIDSVGGILSNTGEATINNQGLLQKTSPTDELSTFYLIVETNNTGTIDVTQNQMLLILGGAAVLNNYEEGVIQGSGIYDITAAFTNVGSVAPGGLAEVGTLSVINLFTINNPGILALDLGGVDSDQYDRIEVQGSPIVQADLQLNLMYEAAIGDTFTVLTSTPSGLSSCELPETVTAVFLDQLYTFEVRCLSNQIELEVIDKVLSVAQQQQKEPSLIINPNPVSERAIFLYQTPSPEVSEYQAKIYNVLGQQVYNFTILPNQEFAFDRDKLKSGIYMVQILAGNQTVASAKMIIK